MKSSSSGSGAVKFRVEYRPTTVKDFYSIPEDSVERIFRAVDALADNPLPHGSKKLRGRKNRFRIKVGVYRVVYRIDTVSRLVMVELIRHRKDIYRLFV